MNKRTDRRNKARAVGRIRAIHQIQSIQRFLVKTYGPRKQRRHLPPLDQLVCTILSQNTTDTNSLEAFDRLKKKYPKWDDVAEAPLQSIAAPIRIGGLARVKARAIRDVLRELREREGKVGLDHLEKKPPKEAMDYLLGFKGVGVKTAACVLLFSFGMPVLPVDTHVHRVAQRLGLIDEDVDRDQAHGLLGELVPERLVYSFHLLMIEHGRKCCHARKPDCRNCPLISLCPTGRDTVRLENLRQEHA